MADSPGIGVSSLKKWPYLTEFLSNNLSFARQIGKNSDDEKNFLKNLNKDMALQKSKISYEKAQSPSPFNIKSIVGSFNVSADGTSHQKKGFTGKAFFDSSASPIKSGKKQSDISSAYRNLKKIYQSIKRNNDEKKYSRNISLKTASYITEKPNTVKELSQNAALALKDKHLSSSENIKELIAGKANDVFQGQSNMSLNDLRKNIEESLFFLLNIGDIIKTVMTNKTAETGLKEGLLYSSELLKSEISTEALRQIGSQESITGHFLSDNIEAAAYLLESPTVRSEILQSASTVKNFVDTFGEKRESYRALVIEKAESLLDRNAFSHAFLMNNIEFSSLVVGTEYLNKPQSFSQYLNAHPDLTKKEFDTNMLIFRYQASNAKQMLPREVGLDENFFIHQKSILNVSLSDKQFRDNLINSMDIIERFFSSPSGRFEPGDIAQISESYLSGYSQRPPEDSIDT